MAWSQSAVAQRFVERLGCLVDRRDRLVRSAIVCRCSEIVERRRSELDDVARGRCERDPAVFVVFRRPGFWTVSRCTSLLKSLDRLTVVLFAIDSPYARVSFKWRSGVTTGAAGE
jgi:hypothetical protein